MFSQITDFFARRRERAHALDAAIRQFESSTGHTALRDMSSVIHCDELSFVVRVCSGLGQPVIPPARAWYKVLRATSEIQELSFEDAKPYDKAVWR